MTTHQFFKVEGIRVISPVFPNYHARPVDPHTTADALNRMYNTDYTAALNQYSDTNHIPPEKALKIAYFFQIPEEISRAKDNATTWIDQLSQQGKELLKIHMRSLVSIPKIGPAQRTAATFILNRLNSQK